MDYHDQVAVSIDDLRAVLSAAMAAGVSPNPAIRLSRDLVNAEEHREWWRKHEAELAAAKATEPAPEAP